MPLFDASNFSDTLVSGAVATATTAVTVGSNSNRVLYWALLGDNTGDLQGEITVTANGNAMTFVTSYILNGQTVFIYRYINPSTGSNTIVANWTTAVQYISFAISCYDCDQTTPERNTAGAGSAGGANPSVGVTSAVGDLVLAFVSVNNDDAVTTPGGQTEVARDDQGGNGITCGIVTTKAGAAGTVTSSWTAASQRWGGIAMSLQPTVSSSTKYLRNKLSTLGLGA